MKRYTIHFSCFEVDEDGDFAVEPHSEVTCDYAVADVDVIEKLMDELYEKANAALWLKSPRRPDEVSEDEEEENE